MFGLIFPQIRSIDEPVALLQEVYRNSVANLSPTDIITYTEILAEASSILGHMNNAAPAEDTLSNSTLTVRMLSFNFLCI